jgi:Putative metallopeptidase
MHAQHSSRRNPPLRAAGHHRRRLTAACAAGPLLAAASILFGTLPAAAEHQPQRILFEYVEPTNPAHRPLYELVQQRRVLEKLQEIFSPFHLPVHLTFRTIGCDGKSNAWYQRPSITLCYEYLHDIIQSMPKETTAAGVTPEDALDGQFFYVVAHEFGHAVFDMLDIPSFGRNEDVADQFSTYIMLHFGKNEARRLIAGAAYSYRNFVQSSASIVPLQAYSDLHGLPAQRFYNLLCMAYGADPKLFADVVEKQYLPKERAADCKREYDQVAFAFQQLVLPHVDRDLARQVMDKSWLPDVKQGPGSLPAFLR